MTQLTRFSDDTIKGKWARITMSDGAFCFIAIGSRSIVVKRSKKGIIGPRLFEVRQLALVEQIAMSLSKNFPENLAPDEMTNVLLRPIVNAVLHCSDLNEALVILVFLTA